MSTYPSNPPVQKSTVIVSDRVNKIIDHYEEMKRDKQYWYPLYELLGEYIMTRKENFTVDFMPGHMENAQVFDSTAINSNHTMASSLIGALWPNSAKTFQITPPSSIKDFETKEITDYYETITREMAETMDNPKANLITALEEYMLDQGAFGTSGISVFEQPDSDDVPVIYNAVDVKSMVVDEGKNKFVDTVYIHKHMTPRQMVLEYGYENLSQTTREAFDKGNYSTKVKVLIAVAPRIDRDPFGFGVRNMPYASIHIEMDSRKILKESGFSEMPILVVRFWKANNEKYGRCPGMNALPDILEVNALREAMILATEKTLDPPLWTYDDGVLGGGVINTSAGAINVFSASGRLGHQGQKPIEPLYTVGELNDSNQEKKDLQEAIGNHFFVDRLLDFNNETRMTLGETNLRDRLRGQSLGTVFCRQIAELFNPLIERTFNILLRRGKLGVVKGSMQDLQLQLHGVTPLYIPDAVVKLMSGGKDVYKIKYISPASRILNAEELQGVNSIITMAQPVAAIDPTILDNFNFDKMWTRVVELTGAPAEMINDTQTVQSIRNGRAQQQAQQAQMVAAKTQSEINRNNGIGAAAAAK